MQINQVEPKNRLRGSLPKIGIRPCIDGRERGVREGLEKKTMGMAQAAKALIQANLRHACGLPVEVVIADTTIGGVSEAALCADKFIREGVEVTLTVTPCWCYGTETMDDSPSTIKAVWGFNGTERPGAVYLAAVLAAHSQKGLPAFGIYGHDVQDVSDNSIPDDVRTKILRFVKCALAAVGMRRKSYLQIGSVCMGIAGSIVNPDFFQEYLGMRTESVDETEVIRRIERGIYDTEEFDRALKWVKAHCEEGEDTNPADAAFSRAEKDAQWEFVVKSYMIVRDLMVGNPRLAEMGFKEESNGHNAITAGFQGQRQWTDHYPNADFPEALLCSSFDWDGIRQPYVVATENDALNGVTMLFEHLLTNMPSCFADVRTYWSSEAVKRVTGKDLTGYAKDGIIHLVNSGATALEGSGAIIVNGKPAVKPWYEMDGNDVENVLGAMDWSPADVFYFRGGGFSSRFKRGTKGGMPVTMARLNLVKGLGPVLQIAEGYSCELDKDVHETLDKRTNPTWPTTWFAPRLTGNGAFKDVYSVMANWGANHAAFCYGHIGADLITLASMLRIPVNMHNISGDDIFRPSYWAAFGTDCLQSADFAACKALGAMFK
jgi:L-fucose isomerase